MRRGVLAAVCLVAAGCGSVASDVDAPTAIDGRPPGIDSDLLPCGLADPFGAPTLVAGVNTSLDETGFTMTRDELTAFVGRTNTGSQTLRMATRSSTADDFGPASEDPILAALNGAAGDEYGASPSGDGLLLYFHRQTTMTIGIQVASRTSATAPFDASVGVTVDGPGLVNALSPVLSYDAQTLYWLDFNVFRMHAATRGTTPSIFTDARDASAIDNVFNPVLSADELTLYSSNGFGNDVLFATRTDTNARFGAGAPLDGVNSAANEWPLFLSSDQCSLYLASARPGGLGGMDIWVARRGD